MQERCIKLISCSADTEHDSNLSCSDLTFSVDVSRSDALVEVAWLHNALQCQQNVVVLEVRWGSLETSDFHKGRIPRAQYLNTDEFETGYPMWKLQSIDRIQSIVSARGIDAQNTTVIVSASKLIAAARVWWTLRYVGVKDCRILNGGFAAWREAGYPIDLGVDNHVARRPNIDDISSSFDASKVQHQMIATTEFVREKISDAGVFLADVRSFAEFEGRVSGYDYIDACGRIPTACFVGDADSISSSSGKLCSLEQIALDWQKHGLHRTETREIVFYCGGGWRSSLAYYVAWMLGFERIRNYSDGWGGWSTHYVFDPSHTHGHTPNWRQQPTLNPIEKG